MAQLPRAPNTHPSKPVRFGFSSPVADLLGDRQARLPVIFGLSVTAHKIAGVARKPERAAPSEAAPLGPRPRQGLCGHPMFQRYQAAMH